MVRVKVTELGDFTTDVSCQGIGAVTFYRNKEIKFQYGFSPLEPKSLRETTSRPIPGLYLFIIYILFIIIYIYVTILFIFLLFIFCISVSNLVISRLYACQNNE